MPDNPFDFIPSLEGYDEGPTGAHRLNRRYDMIVAPFKAELSDARVLDLASHDGRWPYALAHAGAREVVGIEARQALIDRFAAFPDNAAKGRVRLQQGDIFAGMEELVAAGETFDVVAVYGIFYHITEHYRLVLLAQALKPKLIIIDSEFIVASDGPIVRFMREETSNALNTVARAEGREVELVATPSMRLVDVFGEVTGWSTEWIDWDVLPVEERAGLGDYFRQNAQRRRGTVALRPLGSFDPKEKRPRVWVDPRDGSRKTD
ncbi:MAG: class I SAM-dependent methyltransferase [Pseudomonadota bacterium]